MALDVPYISGQADSYVLPGLTSQADTKLFITNPLIQAGDFKIWNPNTSLWDSLATLPTALSALGTAVLISWNAAEAAYEPFVIVWQDAAGAQWCSGGLYGRMTARSIDDLAYPTVSGRSLDISAAGGAEVDVSSINAITDQVWDETLADHLGAGSTGEQLDTLCSTATVFPAGAIEYTYTVTDSSTGLPVVGVDVWISTDNPAVNIIWRGVTDAFGVARDVTDAKPQLDPGTYFIWRHRVGYTDTDPDTEVVS